MNNYTNIINEAITRPYRSLDGIISEYDKARNMFYNIKKYLLIKQF